MGCLPASLATRRFGHLLVIECAYELPALVGVQVYAVDSRVVTQPGV